MLVIEKPKIFAHSRA